MPEPSYLDKIQSLYDSPGASYWIKSALKTLLERDPVDSYHEAKFLCDVLKAQLNHLEETHRIILKFQTEQAPPCKGFSQAQYESLRKILMRNPGCSFDIKAGYGIEPQVLCVEVKYRSGGSIFLGIETDGYAHS